MFHRISNNLTGVESHVTTPRRHHAANWCRVFCSGSPNAINTIGQNNILSEEDIKEAIEEGHAMKDVVKVGRRGACDTLVEHIQKRWNTTKVVKLHCYGKPSNNMKELANEIEKKTRGTVIFRSGGTIILYKPGT